MLNSKQTHLVKRYPGADPKWLLAKPVISIDGTELLGWEDRNGMSYQHYPDDEIYLLDPSRLVRVHSDS